MNIIDAHVVLQFGNWVLEAILPIETDLLPSYQTSCWDTPLPHGDIYLSGSRDVLTLF